MREAASARATPLVVERGEVLGRAAAAGQDQHVEAAAAVQVRDARPTISAAASSPWTRTG